MSFYVILILCCVPVLSFGQLSVSLKGAQKTNISGQQCYEITLTNQGKKEVSLAGQNYRLYYDSENSLFSENSIKSLLPSHYTGLRLVDHHFDVDASGFGSLPYDSHLGFINLGTDLNLDASRALTLPLGVDVAVAEFCFEVTDGITPQITWAQDTLTHTYATAFVEISTMNDIGVPVDALISEYRLVRGTDVDVQEGGVFSVKYYPNPFTEYLTVTFNESLGDDMQVYISDVFGTVLKIDELKRGTTEYIINGDDLPEGAILIEIKTEEGLQSTMKAIKLK